jgi:hypothetical protein
MSYTRTKICAARVTTAMAFMLSACATIPTNRLDKERDGATLTRTGKGVVLIRVTAPDLNCNDHLINFGRRDGESFVSTQRVRVYTASVDGAPPVAEAELPAGEYHLVSYTCLGTGRVATLNEPQGKDRFKTSYANFSVAAGEVVNLGTFQVLSGLPPEQRTPGFPIGIAVKITDWPLADLEKFKKLRPRHYAQMKARLMFVTPPAQAPAPAREDCAQLDRLRKDGKVQTMPAYCR